MPVEKLTERGRIRALLETDRIWAAYALGDLQPGFFEKCAWLRSGSGLVLIYSGFRPPVLFTQGPPDDVREVLQDLAPEHRTLNLSVRAGHLEALNGLFDVAQPVPTWRMVLNPALFPARRQPDVVPLGPESLNEIYDLFAGAPDPPDAFSPDQLEGGVFFGLRTNGRLDAIAGTHSVSAEESVAGVGNVFTRPALRGRHLGTQVTWAVTARLVRLGIQTIVLNVSQQNAAAITLYERLGYCRYCAFYEGIALSLPRPSPSAYFREERPGEGHRMEKPNDHGI